MIRYRLYRWLMKLAHRHGWHHMTTCYPCGDTMLVCHWCGIRIVTHKATDDDRRKLAWGECPNSVIDVTSRNGTKPTSPNQT
jgi:hypothetical protein